MAKSSRQFIPSIGQRFKRYVQRHTAAFAGVPIEAADDRAFIIRNLSPSDPNLLQQKLIDVYLKEGDLVLVRARQVDEIIHAHESWETQAPLTQAALDDLINEIMGKYYPEQNTLRKVLLPLDAEMKRVTHELQILEDEKKQRAAEKKKAGIAESKELTAEEKEAIAKEKSLSESKENIEKERSRPQKQALALNAGIIEVELRRHITQLHLWRWMEAGKIHEPIEEAENKKQAMFDLTSRLTCITPKKKEEAKQDIAENKEDETAYKHVEIFRSVHMEKTGSAIFSYLRQRVAHGKKKTPFAWPFICPQTEYAKYDELVRNRNDELHDKSKEAVAERKAKIAANIEKEKKAAEEAAPLSARKPTTVAAWSDHNGLASPKKSPRLVPPIPQSARKKSVSEGETKLTIEPDAKPEHSHNSAPHSQITPEGAKAAEVHGELITLTIPHPKKESPSASPTSKNVTTTFRFAIEGNYERHANLFDKNKTWPVYENVTTNNPLRLAAAKLDRMAEAAFALSNDPEAIKNGGGGALVVAGKVTGSMGIMVAAGIHLIEVPVTAAWDKVTHKKPEKKSSNNKVKKIQIHAAGEPSRSSQPRTPLASPRGRMGVGEEKRFRSQPPSPQPSPRKLQTVEASQLPLPGAPMESDRTDAAPLQQPTKVVRHHVHAMSVAFEFESAPKKDSINGQLIIPLLPLGRVKR